MLRTIFLSRSFEEAWRVVTTGSVHSREGVEDESGMEVGGESLKVGEVVSVGSEKTRTVAVLAGGGAGL